ATTDDYAVELASIPRNFLVYGSWLATPAVLLRDQTLFTTAGLLTGAAFWALWGWLARRALVAGRSALLVCLVLAAASLAPATVLGDHAVPRYGYGPFAALAVSVVLVLYRSVGPSRRTLVMMVPLLWLVAWGGVQYHLDARYPSGRAFHRLVFKERVSQYLCHNYVQAGLVDGDRVVIVQDASTNDAMIRVLREGGADDLALRLVVGPRARLEWVRELGPEHAGAYVFGTRGENLVPRGRAPGRSPETSDENASDIAPSDTSR
ncbi:hypothetical protein DRQ50_04800, partial [bacterium]